MNYTEIIHKIQKLAKGEDICDSQLCELLINTGCYYLLSKSKQYASKRIVPLTINSIILNERYKACANIFKELNNISYAHIKGPVLSSRIYGNYAYRPSGDIDILVSPEHSEQAKKILLKNGFIQGRIINKKIVPFSRKELIYQKSFSHQLAPFIKELENNICPFINIDINFDIAWGEAKIPIDISEYINHTEPFNILGVVFRRLTPIWEFISLCMHHYKDMNSIYIIANNGLKLSEYSDIYFYLINVSPNADELSYIAKQYHISEYVYYCIYYTNEIFADKRLSVYLKKLESSDAYKLIDCYGLTKSERKTWNTPFYERLLNSKFNEKFYAALNQEEKKKVDINRAFM